MKRMPWMTTALALSAGVLASAPSWAQDNGDTRAISGPIAIARVDHHWHVTYANYRFQYSAAQATANERRISWPTAAAAKAPDPGPGWRLIGLQDVNYYLDSAAVTPVSSQSTLVSTKVLATKTVTSNATHAPDRVFGKPYDVATTFLRKVDLPPLTVVSGRSIQHYSHWRTDTVKKSTPITPYTDYDVETSDQHVDQTVVSTYEVHTILSWIDPFTKQTLTAAVDIPEVSKPL
ncbi:MAG: hypothetical protein KGR26_08900, partial [Cyanobacteria bacterium REEB65]|nr:hypothetical protein [Cyanobacteria bacterium REEB65]